MKIRAAVVAFFSVYASQSLALDMKLQPLHHSTAEWRVTCEGSRYNMILQLTKGNGVGTFEGPTRVIVVSKSGIILDLNQRNIPAVPQGKLDVQRVFSSKQISIKLAIPTGLSNGDFLCLSKSPAMLSVVDQSQPSVDEPVRCTIEQSVLADLVCRM